MSHPLYAIAFCSALALLSVPASADCPEPYTLDALLEDLIATEGDLRESRSSPGNAARRMEQGLSCLDTLMPAMITGRVYRAIGAGLVADGDLAYGIRWMRTAAELEPSFVYHSADLSEIHPARDIYALALRDAKEEPIFTAGFRFVDGAVRLDGRPIIHPAARPHRFHLLQDERDGVVRSWVIDGDVFPLDVLEPGALEPERRSEPPRAAPLRSPPSYAHIDDYELPTHNPRAVPKAMLLLAGGAASVGAAAMYSLSNVEAERARQADTLESFQRHRVEANRYRFSSYGALGLGAGLFVVGLAL